MERNIIVHMKDGTKKKFPHVGRAGGSYTKAIRYVVGFAIIADEYYNETAIPSRDIAEIDIQHR